MTHIAQTTAASAAPPRSDAADRRSFLYGVLALNGAAAVVSFVIDGVTPSWVVYPVLLVGVLLLARRSVRNAAIALAVAAALFVAIHTAFVGEALKGDKCVHPADAKLACHPTSWVVTLGVVPLVTAMGAIAIAITSRQREE